MVKALWFISAAANFAVGNFWVGAVCALNAVVLGGDGSED